MAIQDLAGNPLAGASNGGMLGYIEPPVAQDILGVELYNFLLEPIRTADLNEGALFVQRYLDGPQQVWRLITSQIHALKDVLNITKTPDGLLQYIKNIVGWTPDLDHITRNLDALALRRLIATSAALWKKRGVEDATLSVLQLTTGARLRLYNWFDFRWVLDETVLSEEHQGRDPWVVDLPLPPADDHYLSNIRIVDDGTLDHDLVEGLVRLMRAASERVEISYIDFLDQFKVDDDNSQWLHNELSAPPPVLDAYMDMADAGDEHVTANVLGSADWEHYVATWRIRGTDAAEFGALFYWTDEDNYYSAALDIAGNNVTLRKVVAGAPTLVTSFSFASFGVLQENTYYAIRVLVAPEGGGNRIKVYVDNQLCIDTTDASHTKGTIGVHHLAGATARLSEVEMFMIPLETELIDINT